MSLVDTSDELSQLKPKKKNSPPANEAKCSRLTGQSGEVNVTLQNLLVQTSGAQRTTAGDRSLHPGRAQSRASSLD